MMRNRAALLTALAVDNFGSGLFLPVALLYVTRLPRLLVGSCAGLAVLALRWLSGHLPADALRPEPVASPKAAVRGRGR